MSDACENCAGNGTCYECQQKEIASLRAEVERERTGRLATLDSYRIAYDRVTGLEMALDEARASLAKEKQAHELEKRERERTWAQRNEAREALARVTEERDAARCAEAESHSELALARSDLVCVRHERDEALARLCDADSYRARYNDHVAEVARLRAEVERWKALHAECAANAADAQAWHQRRISELTAEASRLSDREADCLGYIDAVIADRGQYERDADEAERDVKRLREVISETYAALCKASPEIADLAGKGLPYAVDALTDECARLREANGDRGDFLHTCGSGRSPTPKEDHEHTEYPDALRHDGDRASCVCSYCDCDFCASYTYATEPVGGTGRANTGGKP